jgi:hypothetical protein
MHDVVAVALVSGAFGLSGSVGTYWATKRAADRAAESERLRVQAELDRMKVGHAEDHARHRAVVYHELLDVMGHWHVRAMSDPMSEREYLDWLLESEHHMNVVLLVATQPVHDAVEKLQRTIEDAWTGGNGSLDYIANEGYKAVAAVLNETIGVMRTDTAPEASR